MSEVKVPVDHLKQWACDELIRAVDYQFARLVSEHQPKQDAIVYLAALVSFELASGNVCLPVTRLSNPADYWPEEITKLLLQTDWSKVIPEASLLGTAKNAENCLLILDQQRYYLKRYWDYETDIARQLLNRAKPANVDLPLLKEGLHRYFTTATDETDWQKVAAAVAVQKRFSVISGGPGTGKTTTVIKLLALYIEQMKSQKKVTNIKLTAPTGKAAARLAESVSRAKQRLALVDEIAAQIPEEATTLHRLLGVIPNSIHFRHDQENPLHLDLLVLDEASMVDLPMMSRLLSALPATARLILLGDRDQLASVEAGSVLGDICGWPETLQYDPAQAGLISDLCQLPVPLQAKAGASFANCLALLRKSYRFDENSGIGYLARAVNAGDTKQLNAVLQRGFSDLEHKPLNRDSYEELVKEALHFYTGFMRLVRSGTKPETLLKSLVNFQLLCALRKGPFGVEGLNERITAELQARGYVEGDSIWYPGRPVMISRNDPGLGLFNGDIGLALKDEAGRLLVWFEQQGEGRSVLPSRLPEHETVYAMTVHKSQGSEFARVVMLMPPEDSPLLTRELVYTGITRARDQLVLFATDTILTTATLRKTVRAGGLAGRLWR
ncbi:MAG: exodeoxyribonuclease V subunit alpha [Neptuniibacter caesariensis]|uniref:RecBCD enzyme subunit RecD n=1 Tax=Neptuniibacter caesariensis TaxID=207954 RepID=A0A2G6JP89_NEPCE|nr:MAG: exodeoxyribonuclease V subunit alpha [Neptuniibacter caesariensis]